jgi:hypothetical protein
MLFFILYVHLFCEFCCVATPNPKLKGPVRGWGSAVDIDGSCYVCYSVHLFVGVWTYRMLTLL